MSSASQIVVQAFNDAWASAASKTQFLSSILDQALPTGAVSSGVSLGGVVSTPDAATTTPEGDAQREIGTLKRQVKSVIDGVPPMLMDQLDRALTAFLNRHFPPSPEIEAARAWLNKALTPGAGSGVNAAVERNIWNRATARLERDEPNHIPLLAPYSLSLPVSAGNAQTQLARAFTRSQIARQERAAAIQRAELEVANTRFAVEQVVKAQRLALDATRDYIAAVVQLHTFGPELAQAVVTTKLAMIDAAVAAVNAELTLEGQRLRVLIAEAEADTAVHASRNDSLMTVASARIDLLAAEAQSMGQQAAAMLNSVHAAASTGASRSDSVSYSYGGDVTGDVAPRTF